MKAVLLITALIMVGPSPLHAQAPGDSVRLRHATKPWTIGRVLTKNDSSVTVTRSGQQEEFLLRELQRLDVWKRRDQGDLALFLLSSAAGMALALSIPALLKPEAERPDGFWGRPDDLAVAGAALGLGIGLIGLKADPRLLGKWVRQISR